MTFREGVTEVGRSRQRDLAWSRENHFNKLAFGGGEFPVVGNGQTT